MPAHSATTTRRSHRPKHADSGPIDVSRRRFLGIVVAAPVLVAAAELGRQTVFDSVPNASAVAVPSTPQVPEYYDLLDALRDAARPTANLIPVTVERDGTVSFELPRSDNGQGIITALHHEAWRRPLNAVVGGVCQSMPQCSRSRSR